MRFIGSILTLLPIITTLTSGFVVWHQCDTEGTCRVRSDSGSYAVTSPELFERGYRSLSIYNQSVTLEQEECKFSTKPYQSLSRADRCLVDVVSQRGWERYATASQWRDGCSYSYGGSQPYCDGIVTINRRGLISNCKLLEHNVILFIDQDKSNRTTITVVDKLGVLTMKSKGCASKEEKKMLARARGSCGGQNGNIAMKTLKDSLRFVNDEQQLWAPKLVEDARIMSLEMKEKLDAKYGNNTVIPMLILAANNGDYESVENAD